MANSPNDYSNPDVPTNQREFYMLYMQNMTHNKESFESIDKRLLEIAESQEEDRESILGIFDKWDKWRECHDKELKLNIDTLTRHSVTLKIVTWVGSIFGAGFVTFLIAILTGQFTVVRP